MEDLNDLLTDNTILVLKECEKILRILNSSFYQTASARIKVHIREIKKLIGQMEKVLPEPVKT